MPATTDRRAEVVAALPNPAESNLLPLHPHFHSIDVSARQQCFGFYPNITQMYLTDYHAKYFAHELTKRCASESAQ